MFAAIIAHPRKKKNPFNVSTGSYIQCIVFQKEENTVIFILLEALQRYN